MFALNLGFILNQAIAKLIITNFFFLKKWLCGQKPWIKLLPASRFYLAANKHVSIITSISMHACSGNSQNRKLAACFKLFCSVGCSTDLVDCSLLLPLWGKCCCLPKILRTHNSSNEAFSNPPVFPRCKCCIIPWYVSLNSKPFVKIQSFFTDFDEGAKCLLAL